MKQALSVLVAVIFFTACTNSVKENTVKDSTLAAVTLPYPVNYSSDFEIGDKKLAQSVLAAWKDYDNNTLQNSLGIFADSVMMFLADGTIFSGKKDSAIAFISKFRGSMTSATSSVDAVTVLKTKGKDDSWVCVWGKEVDVMKDGKKDSTLLNENWMFNKEGKVAVIRQFAAKEKK
ncbi:hypothetical protein GALL_204650 [mine drainage metagenome]|uniref:SnoaL-like domain protein n=1 Tax=mine drainage metagenome TaxID=410659 RepID=A0A1J5RZW0_9ZZZZ